MGCVVVGFDKYLSFVSNLVYFVITAHLISRDWNHSLVWMFLDIILYPKSLEPWEKLTIYFEIK